MITPALPIAGAMETAWYCVRSQPKHEHIAAANLRRNHGFDVLNPRIRFKRVTARGSVWVTEPVFPGYLFACFNWSQFLRTVVHTNGVSGVVHFGEFWPTIPDNAIHELRHLVGEEEVRTIQQTVEVGEEVELSEGAFAGFTGVVTRVMPARDRVAVLMDFFGQQTVVEVGMAALITKHVSSAKGLMKEP